MIAALIRRWPETALGIANIGIWLRVAQVVLS
jgi:hypothetical protein